MVEVITSTLDLELEIKDFKLYLKHKTAIVDVQESFLGQFQVGQVSKSPI